MNRRISVIGLGYVGLPVATTFAYAGHPIVAFDVDTRRIDELRKGHDRTGEVEQGDIVVYESTVYPGVSEDVYVPVLDIRNTRVVDIVREFEDFGIAVQLHDSEADG